jgi:hypothetical protein
MFELMFCSLLTILPDLVHALLLRIQALLLPTKTLVLSGH